MITTHEGAEQAPRRTDKAIAARRRQGEERKARELQARGWVCIPPEDVGLWFSGGAQKKQ